MRVFEIQPSMKGVVLENAKNVQPLHLNTPFNVVSFCKHNSFFSGFCDFFHSSVPI